MGDLTPIDPHLPKDPARLSYPPTLPIEIALKTAPLHVIREEYGFDEDEWYALKTNPAFIADLMSATEMVKREGMSFKLKARLQAEELLKTSWRLIHEPTTGAAVRADLIKATMRWAGYEQKEAAASGGSNFAIQINLR